MGDVTCYRGVAAYNPQYTDSVLGLAVPRGGPATPDEHNLGDTHSEFTSWTTDKTIAVEKALDSVLGGRGVVLEKTFDEADLVFSPDLFSEAEVLVRGPVVGSTVTWVP